MDFLFVIQGNDCKICKREKAYKRYKIKLIYLTLSWKTKTTYVYKIIYKNHNANSYKTNFSTMLLNFNYVSGK